MPIESNFFKKGIEARLEKDRISRGEQAPTEKKKSHLSAAKKEVTILKRAVRETRLEYPFLSGVPEGVLTDLEKNVYILAIERSYNPWFILKVIKEKGLSLEESVDPEQRRSRPQMLYDLVYSAIGKIGPYVNRDQINLWFQKSNEFYKSSLWRKSS